MLLARAFLLATLALGLLAAPLAADAQQSAKVPRIGYLSGASPSTGPHNLDAFRQGLRELGYVEGKNIVIEYRYAEGKYDRLPEFASELVRLKVDVIFALSAPATRAAKQATTTIPIVSQMLGDPVAAGFVASLARPGGNITGLAGLGPELSGKQLEVLKEVVPRATRVAVLTNPTNPMAPVILKETEAAARALSIRVRRLDVRDPSELGNAFSIMTSEQADALAVLVDPMLFAQRDRIVDLALRSRLPTVVGYREFAEAGALIAYGPSLAGMFHRAATFVDKILKGAKPADLPVEQPTRFELVVNLKTAKALGLTIPQSVLIRADQVIR